MKRCLGSHVYLHTFASLFTEINTNVLHRKTCQVKDNKINTQYRDGC